MNIIDKIIYKLMDKQKEALNSKPIEDIQETADGLEVKLIKQLKNPETDERTKEMLENVLNELEAYRKNTN